MKEEIYEKLKGKIKFLYPGAMKKNSEKNRKKSGKYSKCHKDHGHLIEHCQELDAFLEGLIKEGKVQEYILKDSQKSHNQKTKGKRA